VDWQLVESDEALARLLDRAAGSGAVMVDTEFMRRNTFFPQVALLQLCFEEGDAAGVAWLVDPLRIDDTAPLQDLLSKSDVIKVLHSASEDLEVFQNWLGVLPRPLFDTQRAAAMVGLEFGMGYRAVVAQLCDEDLPKGETRSDWLQRPLTESQCHYAAQDVIYLLPVYQELARRCHTLDRFDWVLEDGETATRTLATAAPDYYRKIKNAWKLQPPQLAVLRAVCDWREATARHRDKPRAWILDDGACLQLAQVMPEDFQQLRARVELPPAVLRKHGETLLELVADQRQLPEAELPAPLPRPLDARQRNELKRLKQRATAIAEDLGVAPQVLVAARDYETLVRGSAEEPGYWQGWRRERVIDPLRELARDNP
jgi:ribonuclease D